jgi:hypothetical protein
MNTRTAVFVFAGLIFVGHVLSERDGRGAHAETKPWASAARTDSGADRVTIDVFDVTRGSAGVKVHNVSGQRLSSVFLQCTFRNQDGSRIDSVPVFVSNLASGDTANESAQMPNDIKASAVDCRTEYAHAG